jgi:hypothetical protein
MMIGGASGFDNAKMQRPLKSIEPAGLYRMPMQ